MNIKTLVSRNSQGVLFGGCRPSCVWEFIDSLNTYITNTDYQIIGTSIPKIKIYGDK